MAAPTYGSIGDYLTGASAASAVVDAPASIATGDIILVFLYKENAAAVTPASGFTLIGTAANTASASQDQWSYAFWKRATGSEPSTYTFSWTGSTWRAAVAVRVVDSAPSGSPIDDSDFTVDAASDTTTPTASVTTTGPDRLIVWCGSAWDDGTWTVNQPTGYTSRLTTPANRLLSVGTATQATAGVVNAGTATTSGSVTHNAILLALLPADFVVGPVTDSGTGDDSTLTVDKTDIVTTQTDSGTGTETATVFADWNAFTDSGTGDDALAVEILVDVVVTDSATGTETIEVADFIGNDLTDAGTGDDVIDVVRTNFVAVTDSGVGTDTTPLEQQRLLTDSGAGTEVLVGLGTPNLTDSGTGSEIIEIQDIPFTQVLPPSRLGNLYDLLVMARIPQPSGAPMFLEVGPIEWSDLTWSNELKAPSDLSVGCQLSSLSSEIIARLRDLATFPCELWLYRNGRLVFAGPIQGGNADGEKVTLSAKGILAYLRHMFVTADLVYKNIDQHMIVKGLVDHWQNQTYGNYGIDTTSLAPSGVIREVTYLKTELHNIAQRIEEMGKSGEGFDFEVDPETRQLQLWSPQKGVDRSSGEDAVVFDSRNITSSSVMFSAGPADIATAGFGTGTAVSGDGTTYSTVTNDELMAKFGRAGVAGTWDQVPNQTTLDAHVAGMVNARDSQLMVPGPDAKDTPDAELFSYGVGDTVLYQPNELLTISAAFRIRKQIVKVAGSGQESVTLEFV